MACLTGTGLLTSVQTSYHEFWSDGIAEVGGQNLGPAPYDLLLAALATCAVMSLRRYSRSRNWRLHRAEIHLAHYAAAAAAGCPQPVGHIEVQLQLIGDLNQDQRQQLRVSAATCPVARLLEPGIRIDTFLA